MSFIGAEIVKELIGSSIASGPVGHGVYSEFTAAGAPVDASTQGVTVEVNPQSVIRAQAVAENKITSKMGGLDAKGSFSNLPAATAKNANVETQQANIYAKHGLDETIHRIMGRQNNNRRRYDARSALTSRPQQNNNPKNVLLRKYARQLNQVRATFAAIPKQQTAPISQAVLAQKQQALAKNNPRKKPQPKAWAGMITEPGFIMI